MNSHFHEFEHRGWEEVALRYDQSWAPVTQQSIERLLDAAKVGRGSRVLDVACGPGYVAAAATARGAISTGIDFSSAMVAEARRRYPHVDFQEGDAEHLTFNTGTFDAVVANYALLHLAEPEQAISEFHRVLKSGGKLAFTVWDTPDKAVAHGIVLRTIRAHGNLDAPVPAGPPFFRFSDPQESTNVMNAAGFKKVKVERVSQTWHLPSPDTLFEVMYNGSVRNAAILRAQRPEILTVIRDDMRRAVAAADNRLPMDAVLVSGSKP